MRVWRFYHQPFPLVHFAIGTVHKPEPHHRWAQPGNLDAGWTPTRVQHLLVELQGVGVLDSSLWKKRLTMRCSEPGGGVVGRVSEIPMPSIGIAILASRAPGR